MKTLFQYCWKRTKLEGGVINWIADKTGSQTGVLKGVHSGVSHSRENVGNMWKTRSKEIETRKEIITKGKWYTSRKEEEKVKIFDEENTANLKPRKMKWHWKDSDVKRTYLRDAWWIKNNKVWGKVLSALHFEKHIFELKKKHDGNYYHSWYLRTADLEKMWLDFFVRFRKTKWK